MSKNLETLNSAFTNLKQSYSITPYPSQSQRRILLEEIKQSLLDKEQDLYKALSMDYGYRSEFDSLISDFIPSIASIDYSIKKLRKWMKPSKRSAGLLLSPSTVEVIYQPLGVVGVIVPWNFPLYLSITPIITALSAGNKVMVKLSEFTPHTNKEIIKSLEKFSDDIKVIEGDAEVAQSFTKLPFDHILFTGSTAVGKLVARAAAENLTPITLELGGKSPVIIGHDSNMEAAVDAIITGKSINSGQICVAPDYAFVPKGKEALFITAYKKQFMAYFGDNNLLNKYSSIISKSHRLRLQSYLDDAKEKGAKIHVIKEPGTELENNIMYPHIVSEVTDEMKIMQEEIFGSLLPIVSYESLDEAISYINKNPRPLALYFMSTNEKEIEKVLKSTHSGGACINDTLVHVGAKDAPFGGIGHSGMGHYHGHEGFLTFSKAKTVVRSKPWLPKNRMILKNRDKLISLLRKLFL